MRATSLRFANQRLSANHKSNFIETQANSSNISYYSRKFCNFNNKFLYIWAHLRFRFKSIGCERGAGVRCSCF